MPFLILIFLAEHTIWGWHGSGINIISASYGRNCKSSSSNEGNETDNLGSVCNYRVACTYQMKKNPLIYHNDNDKCLADYDVEYKCGKTNGGDYIKHVRISGFRKASDVKFTLECDYSM